MNRLALLAVVLLAVPCGAELNVVAEFKDPRVQDHRVFLRYSSREPVSGVAAYLDLPKPETWELVYESANCVRDTVEIVKHNDSGCKVTVRGREVRTLTGRALVIDKIKSNW